MAALPLAGGELKKQAAKLVGASGLIGGDRNLDDAPDIGHMLGYERAKGPRGRALVEILKFSGIPKFKKEEWDWRAKRTARQLDPDIAALHSISLSAAMHMQYKRNRKRYEDEYFGMLITDEDRDSWMKRLGIDWI